MPPQHDMPPLLQAARIGEHRSVDTALIELFGDLTLSGRFRLATNAVANAQRFAGDLSMESRTNDDSARIALVEPLQHVDDFHIVALILHVRLTDATTITDRLVVHPLTVQRRT